MAELAGIGYASVADLCPVMLLQVEMWLLAPESLHIAGTNIHIKKGERLLMEVSRKFTPMRLRALAFNAGWCWQVRPKAVAQSNGTHAGSPF